MARRKKAFLAQQAIWDIDESGRESMPLASAYLKAMVDADDSLRKELAVRICNFGGGATTLSVLREMFFDEVPDIAAFSVLGWNYNLFGEVARVYRQLAPDGWVIFGGNHVSNQADRVFHELPAVDIVVNGEGEITFRELMRAHLAGRSKHELHDIEGISFKLPDGERISTPARARIENLDDIPSPFLGGAMQLTKPNGEFMYDVALMETNRGCPYKCAFCYWGGAIGQKMRTFSIDRLREEVELFARLGVTNICLCDANFGMTKQDEEFMEVLIKARERHGFPKDVITSWAKNKAKSFYRIVRRMKETGFHSSFTLALQSLYEPALDQMGRRNMKVNAWKDLAEWLHHEGLDVYGELIWCLPGETYESFIAGYDELAADVSRIAVYPNLMLPNTEYTENKEKYGFVTYRAGTGDFEYVLAHRTMSIEDNRKGHRFLFWARVVAEHALFRYVWTPLRKLAGVTQSEVLLSLDRWFDTREGSVAEGVRACRAEVTDHFDANMRRIEKGLVYFYKEPGLTELMEEWWQEEMSPRLPAELRGFFSALFGYDWLTRPIYEQSHNARDRKSGRELDGYPVVRYEGEDYYVRDAISVDHDIPAMVHRIINDEPCDFRPAPREIALYYKVGFSDYILNHEFFKQFVGKTESQLRESGHKVDGKAREERPLPPELDEYEDAGLVEDDFVPTRARLPVL